MPLLFQNQVTDSTAAAVWKIEEDETFFLRKVPLLQDVSHPHKRLQHLAGRYLLALLIPHFPFYDIKINEARKPYLPSHQYRFSISHCGDYAAVIISPQSDCGIDIELISPKTEKVRAKYLNEDELQYVQSLQNIHQTKYKENELYTICWCAKEAVYKWWGNGKIDFRQNIQIRELLPEKSEMRIRFQKEETGTELLLHLAEFNELVMAWTIGSKKD